MLRSSQKPYGFDTNMMARFGSLFSKGRNVASVLAQSASVSIRRNSMGSVLKARAINSKALILSLDLSSSLSFLVIITVSSYLQPDKRNLVYGCGSNG